MPVAPSSRPPSPPSPSAPPTRTIAYTEFIIPDPDSGISYTRRRGTAKWHPLSTRASSPPPPHLPPLKSDYTIPLWFTLYLIRFRQLPTDPLLWSLFLAPTIIPLVPLPDVCSVEREVCNCAHRFEVRRDAIGEMHLKESKTWEPIWLIDHVVDGFELGTMDREAWRSVRDIARETDRQQGIWPGELGEEDQEWCIRVLEHLVDSGLIEHSKVEMVRGMMEDYVHWKQGGAGT